MPRHFSSADREYALERIIANRGDVALTARELGMSERLLYKWRQKADMPVLNLKNLPPIAPISPDSPPPYEVGRGSGGGDIPTDDLAALRDLKSQMLSIAKTLADTIPDAIAEAPLGQRVSALAQLTDRIIKLAAQLPDNSEEDTEIRIVFVDEQGNRHTTLPKPEEDSDE